MMSPESNLKTILAMPANPLSEVESALGDVYKQLLKKRIVFLGTVVDDDIANYIAAQLLFLEGQDTNRDIWLYINSPGGKVSAGMAIYDTMQFATPDVGTICIGQAASMGQFLLTAGAKGKRYAFPNSDILMHQPLGGVEGHAADIEIQAAKMSHIKERLTQITANHSGQSPEKIAVDSDRDSWFTAEEAKAYGLIDHVIVSRKEMQQGA